MGAATDRRIPPVLLIAGAVVLGGVFFVCMGVGTVGLLWLRDNNQAIAEDQAKKAAPDNGPHVEVDPAVADIHFGAWAYQPGKREMRASVTVANNEVRRWDCRAEQYDAQGKKLNSSWPDFPRLRIGETGEARIHVEPGATKIVIRPK